MAIEDHAFMIDPAGFRRETVPVLRQQADQSSEAGEQSLNPQGLWRRSQESWHHGAGQDFLDGKQNEEATDPHRFRSSKGIDIWTRGQISLLRPTMKAWSTANTNLHLTTMGDSTSSRLVVADGTEMYYNPLPFGGLNSFAVQTGTGWTGNNATLSASPSSPERFRITATAAGVASATSPSGTSGVPVQAGRRYGFVFGSLYISGGGFKTPRVRVNWYDATGALITSTANFDAPSTDAGFTNTNGDGIAPAGAAFAAVVVTYTTNLAAGEVHEGLANIGPYENVPPGFPDVWYRLNINAGEAAQTVQSIASDGQTVWAALGTSGLHRYSLVTAVTLAANVPAAPASGQISLVGYANGFLLAAGSAGVSSSRRNSLWLVNDPLGTGAGPNLSLIKTHPNTGFEWTFLSGGRSCVYAGGNSGGNGEVYKITFDPNTGTLSSAASPATFLPDGETIHALQFYAGGIIMGTGKGLRLGQADGAGNIDYGPLIETEWPVRCLEPQSRWCWFGWTKYDGTNSGLGRVDLGFFTDNLTPAWASDLMTDDTSSGDVVGCVTFTPYGYTALQLEPVRAFTVAGEGVYVEDPNWRVASGTLETGTIRFSTSEPKTTRSFDIRHHALPAGGPVAVDMQRDASGTWTSIGSSSTTASYGPATPLDLQNLNAEAMEFRIGLDRPDNAGTDFTRSPEVTRWTAKVLPTPSTIDEIFTIPIIMAREVVDSNDANYPMDVDAEVLYLKGLERSRALVTLQLGDEQHTVYLAASEFQGKNWGPGLDFIEGLYVIQAQTVRG